MASSLEYFESAPIKIQQDIGYQFWPMFMNGAVFQSSLLDNMMCFAALRPELAVFLNKFLKLRDVSQLNKAAQEG